METCVTLYPSWRPAAPVRPFSAARERSQAAGLWQGHETPRRGSRQAHSPPLNLGAMLHFLQTMDLQPGGGQRERKERHTLLLSWARHVMKPLSCSIII